MFLGPEGIAVSPGDVNVGGIAVDGSHVYWVMSAETNSAVYRAPKDGSGPTEAVLEGLKRPVDVAIDAKAVYVTVSGDGKILRVAK